jgi:hypothetical protein
MLNALWTLLKETFTWSMIEAIVLSTTGVMIPFSILLYRLSRREKLMDEFIAKYWHL